jgi:hypothetical protein
MMYTRAICWASFESWLVLHVSQLLNWCQVEMKDERTNGCLTAVSNM